MTVKNDILTENWGLLPYPAAMGRQLQLVADRIGNERPDTLVFVEHPPVYTLGVRPEAQQHVTADAEFLQHHGIEIVKTNRGGDVTVHAPGQMVVYPIVKLEGKNKDLHVYLRNLEEVVIRTLAYVGLAATRNDGKTGVWVAGGPGRDVPMKKIAAVGVAVKQWVTYHGVAINVSNDLRLFEGIVPCGLAGSAVTSIKNELKENSPSNEELQRAFVQAWGEVFIG